MFVIINNGKYAAKPGRKSSFTTELRNAQKFDTEEEAKRNACGNEVVREVTVLDLLDCMR